MIVRVGSERFIIPTISIEQSLRPQREQITTVQGRGEILNVRGKLIPLIQLGELFHLSGRIAPCDAMVVTAECEGRSIGLVAQRELIGQRFIFFTKAVRASLVFQSLALQSRKSE